MKTLTLTQPWATLVAIGAKRIETRSWRTPYRGSLAIHASRKYPRAAQMVAISSPFIEALNRAGYLPDIPLGAVVATCRLISCVPTRELQTNRVIEVDYLAGCDDFLLDDREREFGDYSLGRWAWLLADVRPLSLPSPAKGALGLWDWDDARAVSESPRVSVQFPAKSIQREPIEGTQGGQS
jgi:hypothetical protein